MTQIYNRIVIGLLIAFFIISCKKKQGYPIPEVSVNILLNLDLPAYQNLNNPGGWAYINGGSKGIIVYRNFNEFVAFDRHTTVYPDSICSIAKVDSINEFVLNDPCSEAQYSISTGTVIKEPAKWALKQYFTVWDGAFSLQVTN